MVELEGIIVRAVQSTATFVVVVLVGAFLANYPKPPNQVSWVGETRCLGAPQPHTHSLAHTP